MYTFDLQLLLFALIALLVLAAGGAIWLDRRLTARGRAPGEVDLSWPTLNEAPFGVLSLAGTEELRFANLAARRLLELEDAAGTLPEVAWADQLLADADAARAEGAVAGRYRMVALPPDRLVRWWAIGGGELIFLFDASEQQRTEQAARRLLNDLAHELRTPLATILTHAEVQSLSNLPDVTRAESLQLLKEEAQRAVRLVNAMLELGRLETSAELAQRPVDLLAIAEAAVEQTMPEATARSIQLAIEADTPLAGTVGDADQLLRVFLNLLDNAVKYSRPSDRVLVSLQREPAGVRCSVCDSGPGIPPQHLPHVTRRFYRVLPQEQPGSGLGLSLVEEILRRHGSSLHIESRTDGEDSGTCAEFLLPAQAHQGETL